jgi:competence protein ComEA
MLSRLMTRREQAIVLSLAGALVLGAGTLYAVNRPSSQENAPLIIRDGDTPGIEALPQVAQPAPAEIVVSVAGAVRSPGVFRFTPADRVIDAIERAGGSAPEADTATLNLAAKLLDGTTLIVPGFDDKPEAPANPAPYRVTGNPPAYTVGGAASTPLAAVAGAVGRRINVNTASQAELETLPGIGPTYARAIIAHRAHTPFRQPSDLMQVQGIGPKRFENIRDLIAVE